MMHSLKRLKYIKARATGKRLAALLLCCLLLPAMATAEVDALFSPLEREMVSADTQRFVEDLLGIVCAEDSKVSREVRLGNWYIHPEGFAFQVPAGLSLAGPYKRGNLKMVAESEDHNAYSTSIVIAILQEEADLENMTEDTIKSAYAGTFQRFELKGFRREAMFGTEGVRLSFVTRNNPQLLVQQCIFNRNGKNYSLTLSVENSLASLQLGLSQFSSLCTSMIFYAGPEAKTAAN